ncbi:MAG: hypothetical protein JXR59_08140 [Desulfuromonadaceae bacterium]|nr:hypothetical protein [Desulfuromonadaceae bacterium]
MVVLLATVYDKTGIDALKEIRELEDRANVKTASKVFMVTMMSDRANMKESYDEGCDAYLTKPVTREEVEAAMRK